MRLLICTQAVDKNHPILGFFHRWIEEFAKHCEVVHVICLIEGQHSLPENVHVHSLGKEGGENRIKYIFRFYRYIWQFRKEYDAVFVHMNQIYVILGFAFWKFLKKKVSLWYMHKSTPLTLRLAEKFVDVIFTGSKESFRLPSKKVVITGHGIDTFFFSPNVVKKDIDILTVGRITPSKNLHALIDMYAAFSKANNYRLAIVGHTMTRFEEDYKHSLEQKVVDLGIQDKVTFLGSITQSQLPALINRARVFAHVAQNGSLDKSTLEALACCVPVVTMAQGAESLPLGDWYVRTAESFKEQLVHVLESSNENRVIKLREYVVQNHSLEVLIPKLVGLLKSV